MLSESSPCDLSEHRTIRSILGRSRLWNLNHKGKSAAVNQGSSVTPSHSLRITIEISAALLKSNISSIMNIRSQGSHSCYIKTALPFYLFHSLFYMWHKLHPIILSQLQRQNELCPLEQISTERTDFYKSPCLKTKFLWRVLISTERTNL
jgi:hypothetical protein